MKYVLPRALVLGVLSAMAICADEPMFPGVDELPAGASIRDPDSTRIVPFGYEVDGRRRFLIGVQIANTYADSLAHVDGYPESMNWIYDRPLDADAARRLGIDAVSYFSSDAWISAIDPSYSSFHHGDRQERAVFGMIASARLPVFPDFTLGDWSNGALATNRMKGKIPAAALNIGGSDGESNHWVPYSATTAEGRALYRAMWRKGAADLVAAGRRAALYELFNEPGYDDPSPDNRAEFARRLRGRYGSIAELNRVWGSNYNDFPSVAAFKRSNQLPGLQVEWSRFMEDCFVDLCRVGIEEIRLLDPAARFSVQPMGADRYRCLPASHVNVLRVHELMDVVSAGTSGGTGIGGGLVRPTGRVIDRPDPDNSWMDGMLHRMVVRAVAGDKPIQNSEAYPSKTGRLLANTFWLELMRGGDASFLFQWDKRAWDRRWKPEGSAAGGRVIAMHFPWLMLNPHATPTEVLTGMMRFRREQLATRDVFLGREHFSPADVAILVSFPSERIAPAVGSVAQHEVRRYAAAATLAHYGVDALLEEQVDRLGRYRAVVVAGADYGYPETVPALRSFVEQGGTVILALGTLANDDLGRPLPAERTLGPGLGGARAGTIGDLRLGVPLPDWISGPVRGLPWKDMASAAGWEELGSLDGRPVMVERRVGAGRIICVNARSSVYGTVGLLGALLGRAGIMPETDLRTWVGGHAGELAPHVEVRAVRRAGLRAWMLFNWDRYPKLVALRPAAGPGLATVIDPIGRRGLPVVEGRCLVPLQAHGIATVVEGSPEALAGFGFDLMSGIAAPDALDREVALGPAEGDGKVMDGAAAPYACAANRCSSVDLRAHANRGFVDRIAGDGAGGWTDQGRDNSLDGVPFGSQSMLGVPMEIIRFDENADRTCVVLSGDSPPVTGIEVGKRASALYFLAPRRGEWVKHRQAASLKSSLPATRKAMRRRLCIVR